MKKVLIFDYDGTIADSLDGVVPFVNSLLPKYGLSGFTKEQFVRLYDDNFFEGIIKAGFPRNRIHELVADIEKTDLNFDVKFFSNIKEVIKKLSSHHSLLLLTSAPSKYIKETMWKAGFAEFKDILGADEGLSKVAKFELVKNQNSQADLYYICDTIGDIGEAKKAKVKTIAVTWGYHSKEHLIKLKPDFIAESPNDLLNIFKEER